MVLTCFWHRCRGFYLVFGNSGRSLYTSFGLNSRGRPGRVGERGGHRLGGLAASRSTDETSMPPKYSTSPPKTSIPHEFSTPPL